MMGEAATGPLPTAEDVATMQRLRDQLDRYRARHGAYPTEWVMARRVARSAVATLRTMLDADDGRAIPPEELTRLWGVPVTVVAEFPQGAVCR